jgi:3-hydroxyisobutyrate dehydrogenase
MSQPRIGFIGLGIMGRPMCKNLIQAGYPMTVWNRSRDGIEAAVGCGAAEAGSAREVAERSDVVITMVSDSPDVRQVALGEDGLIHGAKPDSVVIDMSTISPSVTREIAAALQAKGVHMLDAPVSGGEKGAIEGTLSIMVGGDEPVFERCRPLFEAMGKVIVYIGTSGSGQVVKQCNQVAAVIHLQAMCEALILAARAGVDPARMLQAVSAGAAGSWMLSNLAPRILQGDLNPGFMVKLQQKDLRLVMETAEELHLPLPATALVNQFFRSVEAEENGGNRGTQALITTMEKLAGVRVTGGSGR